MDTTDEAIVTQTDWHGEAELLNDIFGGLRAEYFRNELFQLFAQPSYWPELLGRRPCLLIGGRGTGKTTVLRGLSYEGQSRLNSSPLHDWDFVGLYWRIDTSVVAAFRGATVSDETWIRLFAHYVNLMLAQLVAEFLQWVEETTDRQVPLKARQLRNACESLGLVDVATVTELVEALEDNMVDFESVVNNIDESGAPRLSILGRPVQYLIDAIDDRRLLGKTYFFLLDEYENFEDYQQRVVNTLVKHAGDHSYTLKIGMRETGHRERATLNPDEQLIEPADYAYINIAEELKSAGFSDFARKVCEGRLKRLGERMEAMGKIDELLPGLSEEAEAVKLGVSGQVADLRADLQQRQVSPSRLSEFDAMHPLSAYLVRYWSNSTDEPLEQTLDFALTETDKWNTRLSNYQHAMLYTIRKGKRGIRKYYSGWNTYVHLADGNIRYLLQLVHEALQEHLRAQGTLARPVSPEAQTQAAQDVGGRIVEQLQGVSAQGAGLTRLVLGLGRVFQVMAAQPEGHTPEVSQFRVRFTPGDPHAVVVEALLTSAVMHLAVRRFPTDKMAAVSGDTKDYSYQLHPIFAPFFVFSYRSKRRIELSSREVRELVTNPPTAIRAILAKSRREDSEDLPEQLFLFKEFFGDDVR